MKFIIIFNDIEVEVHNAPTIVDACVVACDKVKRNLSEIGCAHGYIEVPVKDVSSKKELLN